MFIDIINVISLSINIRENDIHDESIKHLCETIQNLKRLNSLKL
jgi:hypothetical protein